MSEKCDCVVIETGLTLEQFLYHIPAIERLSKVEIKEGKCPHREEKKDP